MQFHATDGEQLEAVTDQVRFALDLIRAANDADLQSPHVCVITTATVRLERDLEIVQKALEMGRAR